MLSCRNPIHTVEADTRETDKTVLSCLVWRCDVHVCGVVAGSGDRLPDAGLDEAFRRVHLAAVRLARVAAARQSTGRLQCARRLRAHRVDRAVRDVRRKPAARDAATGLLSRLDPLPVPAARRHRVRGARSHQSQAAQSDGDATWPQTMKFRRDASIVASVVNLVGPTTVGSL